MDVVILITEFSDVGDKDFLLAAGRPQSESGGGGTGTFC